jgi:predicted Zn-ribbon and HTH transcriptional regulator
MVKIAGYECKRCGHVWLPRVDHVPVRCPACKSVYWQRDRTHPQRIRKDLLAKAAARRTK